MFDEAQQLPPVLGWRLPAAGFVLYSIIGMVAHILGLPSLLLIGAGLMFLCVLAAGSQSLARLRVDPSVAVVMSILVLAVVATLYDPTHTIFHNLLKHVVICIMYVLIFSMGLRPIYSTPFCKVFLLTLLFMGAVSLMMPRGQEMDDVTRMSGFFVNANNLGLTMMTLLFLIDENRDGVVMKVFVHAVIILFLILSGTSGAILAYLGAMVFKSVVFLKPLVFHTSARTDRVQLIAVVLVLSLICLGCLLPASLYQRVPLANRLVAQLSLIREELPLAVSGYELDYARLSSVYGESSGSGIWRIAHWRKGVDVLTAANSFQLLVGHGIGSSGLLLDKVPHNDYLRVLIEQGLLGLTLSLAFFAIVLQRIDSRHRYCVVAIALYCICENNMDNLLFMSIFTFFLASAQNRSLPHPLAAT